MNENFLFSGDALPKIQWSTIKALVYSSNSGENLSAHCNCMAGLAEVCTAVASIFFWTQISIKVLTVMHFCARHEICYNLKSGVANFENNDKETMLWPIFIRLLDRSLWCHSIYPTSFGPILNSFSWNTFSNVVQFMQKVYQWCKMIHDICDDF